MHLIELARHDAEPFFHTLDDRVRTLRSLESIGRRYGLELLGWRLDDRCFRFAVDGPAPALPEFRRLSQSAFGLRHHHRDRPPVIWAPPTLLRTDDLDLVLQALHAGRSPWSSLWDLLGLRDWGIRPTLNVEPERLVTLAGLPRRPSMQRVRPSLETLGRALLMVTAQPAMHRDNSVAYAQLALRCQWSVSAVASARRLTRDSVLKAIRKPIRPSTVAALRWLHSPLRRVLDEALPQRAQAMPEKKTFESSRAARSGSSRSSPSR